MLPQELNYLEIEAGEDLCTLVTCTPYGVNTHRLLVRGHRIYESDETETSLRENRNQNIFTLFPGIILLGGIAFLLFFIIYIHKKRSYKGKRIKNRHGGRQIRMKERTINRCKKKVIAFFALVLLIGSVFASNATGGLTSRCNNTIHQ